jgi:hypothetical protein
MLESFDFEEFWRLQSSQARLCVATSAGLLIASGLGVAVNVFAPRLVPVELLSCAGILYAQLALASISWRRASKSEVLRTARWNGRHVHEVSTVGPRDGSRPQA